MPRHGTHTHGPTRAAHDSADTTRPRGPWPATPSRSLRLVRPPEEPCRLCWLLVAPIPGRLAHDGQPLYASHDGPCKIACGASVTRRLSGKVHGGSGCEHCQRSGTPTDLHRTNGGVWPHARPA